MSVSPWWYIVPLQACWLSIPLWLAAGRARTMKALAERHGWPFSKGELPPGLPANFLPEGMDAGDARNVVYGQWQGYEFLAFDFGGDRSQRAQTCVARTREHPFESSGPALPNGWKIASSGPWVMAAPDRNWFQKIGRGVLQPGEIESLWKALG